MILGRSFALPVCRFTSVSRRLSSDSYHIFKRQFVYCQATATIFSSDSLYTVKRQLPYFQATVCILSSDSYHIFKRQFVCCQATAAIFSVSPGTPLVAIIKVALHYFTDNFPRIHSETVDNYAVVKLGPGFN